MVTTHVIRNGVLVGHLSGQTKKSQVFFLLFTKMEIVEKMWFHM
jgi:hypothetical protein